MPETSFRKAIALSASRPVFLVKGTGAGKKPCWSYVEVGRGKENAFLKAVKTSENFCPADFGRIISSDWGEEPQEAVTDFLREEGVID
jgi:hypothetical protein